jgi:hypothetical protein
MLNYQRVKQLKDGCDKKGDRALQKESRGDFFSTRGSVTNG